jgi:predicted nucleic acid-binding protein
VVGVTSGAVYDALHVVAAELAGATAIVTLDAGDFERFRIDVSPRIVVPPDDGGLL